LKRTGVKEVYIFKLNFHSFKRYIEEEKTKVRQSDERYDIFVKE
jgi:hypothetical protein